MRALLFLLQYSTLILDDLSSLGSISFSQVGKRSHLQPFEEVETEGGEEMENHVVYNQLQDSEAYDGGHLQKRETKGNHHNKFEIDRTILINELKSSC